MSVYLGELVDIVGGGTPSKSNPEFWGGTIPWASVKDFKTTELLKTADFITEAGVKESATNVIPAENIILPTRMALGKVAINKVDMAINQDLKALIVKDKNLLSKRYLLRFLESKSQYLVGQGKGATVKGITLNVLRGIEIPLPSLTEQKRITAILDKASAVHSKRQQAIQLADEFLRAVFLDLFGDPVTNPKGWEVKPLKEHILHANNGLSRRRKDTENIGEIVLRLQDVHYDGIRFEKDLNRISLDEKEKARYQLEKGDILFIRVNGNPDYVGRSSVFEGYREPVYHNDHLIRLKIGEAYTPQFLSYCFNYKGGRKIISGQTKTSAGQHTISQGGIETLNFYLPPIVLQQKFVSIQRVVLQLPYDESTQNELFASLSQKAFKGEL